MKKIEYDFLMSYLQIKNSTIRVEDGIEYMDVDGHVNISHHKLTYIPFNFGVVNGDFICGSNYLSSLKGAPRIVKGIFHCSFNKLTSLEYSPKEIHGAFNAAHNLITSLEHGPEIVKGEYFVSGNKLINLDHIPFNIGDTIWTYRNELKPEHYNKLFDMGYRPEQIKSDNEMDIFSMYRQWQINNIVK